MSTPEKFYNSLHKDIEEKDSLPPPLIRRVKVADIFSIKEEATNLILRTATMEWPMLGKNDQDETYLCKFKFMCHSKLWSINS